MATQTDDLRDPPNTPAPRERLDSWKEIAAYLNCSERTVRRWEEEGLPVHRHVHKSKAAIYAYKAEIDAWWRNGHDRLKQTEELQEELPSAVVLWRQRPWLAAATVLGPRFKSGARRFLALAAGIAILLLLSRLWLLHPGLQPRVVNYTQLTQFRASNVESSSTAVWWHPLVTDGLRIYFSRLVEDRYVLAQISVEGGEAVPIATPFRNTYLLDIDSNGSKLLVAGATAQELEKPLWALPLPAGSPRRLGDLVGHDGGWSPDGERLVYASGSAIYVAKAEGAQSQKLVTIAGYPRWLRWSPKGTLIRFTVADPSTHASSLWEIRPDGTGLRPLLPNWDGHSASCCGIWTQDERYFVFQSNRNDKDEIWALPERQPFPIDAGKQPVQLAAGPMSMACAVPSRDAKKLFALGTLPRGELARYDSNYSRFVSYLSGASVEHLAFSQNGEWVSYITLPGAELWRSRTNGEDRLQLTFAPMQAGSPVWSPDTSRIAFFGRVPGKPWRIYSVSADGGAVQQLTTGDRDEADPAWSADGTVIAFDNLSSPFTIHLLDLKTGQLSTLPNSDSLWSPLWSSDGKFIAAKTYGYEKLFLFDLTAKEWKPLGHLTVGYFHWSSSRDYIYFGLCTRISRDPHFRLLSEKR